MAVLLFVTLYNKTYSPFSPKFYCLIFRGSSAILYVVNGQEKKGTTHRVPPTFSSSFDGILLTRAAFST